MPFKPVDTAIKVTLGPAIDDTDFKTREEAIAYNAAGLEVDVILEKYDGTVVTTAVTPTTGGGDYDWAHTDQGEYELKLPASGGASFNNTEEGILKVVAHATGVLPFRSVAYDIVPIQVYDSIVKGTDLLDTNVAQISDDATAADNLEATYDGTGYTDPFGPAHQQQVDNLAIGSAGIVTTAEGATVSTGTETNTYTGTQQADGTYHQIAGYIRQSERSQ